MVKVRAVIGVIRQHNHIINLYHVYAKWVKVGGFRSHLDVVADCMNCNFTMVKSNLPMERCVLDYRPAPPEISTLTPTYNARGFPG